MNALVLGAGGFIGSHLCQRLVEENFKVTGVDVCGEKISPEILPQMTFHLWDIRDHHKDISKLISKADLVLDLIAYANPIIYLQRPIDVVEINFFENLFVARECIRAGNRLVQFSTCEVYGMTGGSDRPFSEDSTPLIMGPVGYHRWIYASGKQFLERILHAHGLADELDYTIIRPFNFIGPRMDFLIHDLHDGIPRVIPIFMSALLSGMPLYLVDGGRQRRSFTYISDALDALMLILHNPKRVFHRQICNVGNPANETDIAGLAALMIRLYEEISGTTCGCNIEVISGEKFYGRGYQDCDRRIPEVTKLQRCGWQPRVSLEEALRRTIRYYLQDQSPQTESLAS